jgi:cytidylate kinase
MKTIAISRLVGSEAARISQRVAEALGYTLINKSDLLAALSGALAN